jgi:hypothetical protein
MKLSPPNVRFAGANQISKGPSMNKLTVRCLDPAPQQQAMADPEQIMTFIDAWELAKVAYGEVLRAGMNRSDSELAQDPAYGQLLQAGLRIYKLGGSDAVEAVSKCLGQCLNQGNARHFARLWNGLVPETAH